MQKTASLGDVQREYEQLADQLANTHISNFVDEIILLVFQRLPWQSLLTVRAVSHSWKNLAEDNAFWKEHIPKVFSQIHCSSIKQRTDLNYCSHIIRQKQIEAGLRSERVEKFERGYLTQVGASCITETSNEGNQSHYIQPQELEFQDNKLYLCKNNACVWPTLLIQDRTTSTCEEVPLKLNSAKVDQYRDFEKKFSFVTSTSAYLIFDVILDNHSLFFRSSVNKFCIYDRNSKKHLWESEENEKCAEIMPSVQSSCIFSHITSKKNNTVTIRARDIQTGTILFESDYVGTVETFTCALSGILHFKINNQKEKLERQYVIYKDKNNFTTKRCIKVSNINSSGNMFYQDVNKKIFLLKIFDTSYFEILYETQKKAVIFNISNQDQFVTWAVDREAERAMTSLRTYICEKYSIANYIIPPITHYKISDITGGNVGDFCWHAKRKSRILGFENDLMIHFCTPGLVEVFDLKDKKLYMNRTPSLCGREISNKSYESFYKDGMLFLQQTQPYFGSPLWSYIDFTKLKKSTQNIT